MLQLKEIDGRLQVCFVNDDICHVITNVLQDTVNLVDIGFGVWDMSLTVSWMEKGRS